MFWFKKKNNNIGQKAVLHIGIEKTGTTSIQEFLHLNRKLLQVQSINFPSFLGTRNHLKLAAFCMNDDNITQFAKQNSIDTPQQKKEWNKSLEKKFSNEIKQISKQVSTVIFSSEHFASYLKSQNEILRLKDFLSTFFYQFQVIIYIRRQDLIACSMAGTMAKAGIENGIATGNNIIRKQYYNFDKTLKKWSLAFGKENICLRVFEESKLLQGDLILDFMHAAGIKNNPDFSLPSRLNTSPSAMAIEAAWHFIKIFPEQDDLSQWKLMRDFRVELMRQVSNRFPGPPKRLHKADAVNIYNFYHKSNLRVARQWLDREDLFMDDFSMYPETGNEPQIDQKLVGEIVDNFIARNPTLSHKQNRKKI